MEEDNKNPSDEQQKKIKQEVEESNIRIRDDSVINRAQLKQMELNKEQQQMFNRMIQNCEEINKLIQDFSIMIFNMNEQKNYNKEKKICESRSNETIASVVDRQLQAIKINLDLIHKKVNKDYCGKCILF